MFTDSLRVPTSVMPKGVEHIPALVAESSEMRVPTSVMPKGVEHLPVQHGRPSEGWCRPL